MINSVKCLKIFLQLNRLIFRKRGCIVDTVFLIKIENTVNCMISQLASFIFKMNTVFFTNTLIIHSITSSLFFAFIEILLGENHENTFGESFGYSINSRVMV